MQTALIWSAISHRLFPLAIMLALMPPLLAADDPDDQQWSIIAPLARESLLLDGAAVDDLVVVVGERGHVLLSLDSGASWRQVRVPTRATLTGVFFSDRQNGWAVGHDAVILKTSDGGETWKRVHFAPEEERPLLDVWFEDENHGIATGAYGYFLETFDGGETWEDRLFEVVAGEEEQEEDADVDTEITAADMMDFLEDEDPIGDLHLNDIRSAPDGKLYIAAEAGHVFSSEDVGETWKELASPYEGSFYGTLPLGGDRLLLYGLRGNLFYSEDGGVVWEKLDIGTDAILMGGSLDEDGSPVVVGLGGTLLVAATQGPGLPDFELQQQEDRAALATIVAATDGNLVLIGEHGAVPYSPDDFKPVEDE